LVCGVEQILNVTETQKFPTKFFENQVYKRLELSLKAK